MSIQQRGNRAVRSTQRRRSVEMLLFLVASVIGIYGLGRGLTGLFEPGQGIDLLWLAITGVAMMMLFAQMGRVHDTWPRQCRSYLEYKGHQSFLLLPNASFSEKTGA